MSSQDHIEIELSNSTIRWYRDKGYDIPTHKVQLWLNKNGKKEKHGTEERIKKGTKIIVKINDLQPESNQHINLFCSNCNEKFSTQFKIYRKRKSDLCKDCAKKRIKGDGSHGYWVNKLITLNPDAKCDISGETDKRFLALHHLDSRKNGGKNTKDNYIILTHNYHFAFHNSLGGTNIPCTKQDYYRFKEKELFKTESQKGNFFNTGNKFQSESKPEVTTRFNDEDKNRVKIRSFTDELFANIFSKQNSETNKTAPKTLSEALNVKKMTYDQAKLYRLGQLKTDYICVKSLYPKNNNECKCSSCQQESKSSLEKIADEIHNDLQSQTETKKSESKQDDCLDCATSFLGICDKHFTQKLKEIDKQTEKQYMENMKNAEDPIAFFNSLITLVELNKKNKVNPELVEELLDETFIGKKSINEQEDVSTGSLFDIAYCVLENVVLHELDKDINKPFWDFIREAKKQGYKRVVLTNGKQYEINDDGSVTTLK